MKLFLILFSSLLLATPGAFGEQERKTIVVTNQSFLVNEGKRVSVNLPKRYFLHQLFIYAESANSQDAFGEVVVNGDVKGSL